MSLANRYRPQLFADVVGQKLATTALSRASSEDRVAPAYLLSGTRGVGKTTIARIFAKALNCEHAPAAEPCNVCGACQRVTSGNHVDVTEIDGASNTSVDDVRALRENIGFAPMEGRYKIFIIDEAHMLSKSAFNALLKTLEEPPPRAVFIFATTEAHKFPATIISRCQHFVFRHLPEELIFNHLRDILGKENIPFEDGAVQLIAKRAQGSARDSLSLLDQALALGPDILDTATVRESLGLAGQEFFGELFVALQAADFPRILELCRQILSAGVDIGFFMREFATNLRNLFLFSQSGDAILPVIGVSGDEREFIKKHAALFTGPHLHAAWQMALDSQRGIGMSPEPGAALELLLLNLAMIPRLLPVGNIPMREQKPQNYAKEENETKTAASLEEDIKKNSENHPAPPKTAAPKTMPKANPQAETAVAMPAGAQDSGGKWGAFRDFCQNCEIDGIGLLATSLINIKSNWRDDELTLWPETVFCMERLEKSRRVFDQALSAFCQGKPPRVEIVAPEAPKSDAEIMAICEKLPEVSLFRDILGAKLIKCKKNS